jgi:signal peptidase I
VDPLAYEPSVESPRPWATGGEPTPAPRGPVAVPELPAGATPTQSPIFSQHPTFSQIPAPVAVPELASEEWPPWLLPPGQPGRGRWRWALEWLIVLGVAVVLAFGVRIYVAQMFYIPSGSMLPTLQVGDRIVVDKLSYHLHTVSRGDVVVFKRPPLEQADYPDLVKRVIGLPGDTIASVRGRITINGRPLAEPWLPVPVPETLPSPLAAPFSLNRPYTVPPGEYYVMGDNRTDSEDSRYFGPIPADLIVGKMMFKAWPLSGLTWLVALAVIVVAMLALGLWTFGAPVRRHPAGRTRRRGPPVSAGAPSA